MDTLEERACSTANSTSRAESFRLSQSGAFTKGMLALAEALILLSRPTLISMAWPPISITMTCFSSVRW